MYNEHILYTHHCVILPTYIGFFVAGALRYVCVLHASWAVNSLAHLYGDQPYDQSILPSENILVTVMSLGDGYHNWHHKFPYDYAGAEKGCWVQFNPTKFFIDIMYGFGQVYERKRARGAYRTVKASQDTIDKVGYEDDKRRAEADPIELYLMSTWSANRAQKM